MEAVFFRLAHGVYTMSTHVALLPEIELAFTSCAQSSSVSAGMSSMVRPTGSRRYTCADDRSSTWNLRHYVIGALQLLVVATNSRKVLPGKQN